MSIRLQITLGAAKGFFTYALQEQAKELGVPMIEMPDTLDPGAMRKAEELVEGLSGHGISTAHLYQVLSGSFTPEQWGFFAALESLGAIQTLFIQTGQHLVPSLTFGYYQLEQDYYDSALA